MFKLGERLRDRVTGFEGIATHRTEYLNGCIQYSLTPRVKGAADKYPEGVSLDVENLERVSSGILVKAKPSGGPPRRGKRLTHK